MVQINTKKRAKATPAYLYAENAAGEVVKGAASGVYNVKNFGPGEDDTGGVISIGSNTEQALSLVYANLTAAQARYPRATALTESFDWHAHQLAIDTARMAGGGCVYTPAGYYKMNGPTALIFPLSNEISTGATRVLGSTIYDETARVPIDWVGDGETISRLYWDTDKGSAANDNFAVQFGDIQGVDGPSPSYGTANSRYGLNCVSSGVMRDLGLIGPCTITTIDTKGCNMSGIQWCSRRRLEHVRIEKFWAGVDIVGDHTPWYDIFITGCFYGFYFNYRSSSMYGDHSLGGKCMFDSMRKACWGFHAGGWANNWHVYGRCFMGNSPYGIFREDTAGTTFPTLVGGGTGTAKNDWLSHCKFDLLFFENIGNACIADDNIRLAQTGMNFTGNVFTLCTLSNWSSSKKIGTGSHPRCFMSVGKCYGFKIEFTLRPGSAAAWALTTAYFNIPSGVNGLFEIAGDIEGLNADCITAGQQLVNVPEQDATAVKLYHYYDNSGTSQWWEGRMYRCYATITRGDVMTSSSYGVQAGSTTHINKIIIGIARGAATSGQAVPVAEVGSEIAVNTTGVVAGGDLLALSSTAGKGIVVTDITAAGVRPIGQMHNSTNITIPKGGVR